MSLKDGVNRAEGKLETFGNNLRERQQIKLNGDSTGVSSENFRENVIQVRSVSKAEETQRNHIQKSTMKGK